MEKNPGNLNKTLEKQSIDIFNKLVLVRGELNVKINEFEMMFIEGEGDRDAVLKTKKDLERIGEKYKNFLKGLGLKLRVEEKLVNINSEDMWDIEAEMEVVDVKEFAYFLKNLPNNFLTDENESRFTSSIEGLIDKDIENLYKKDELSDNLIELTKYSDEIGKKLENLFGKNRSLKQERILDFYRNYKDAFKDGYLKELSGIYFKNINQFPWSNPEDLYTFIFTYQNDGKFYEFRDKDESDIEDAFRFQISERIEDMIEILNIINPEKVKKTVISQVLYKIKQIINMYSEVPPLIQNDSLRERYKKTIKNYREIIYSRMEILNKNRD